VHFLAMEEAIGTAGTCAILGKPRSALYRQRNPKPAAAAERKEFRHPAELSGEEKEQVLAVLDSPRFADKAVAQAYTILLDEGRYLCSQATMHRLLRERGTSDDRRAQAVHPARKEPGLLAAGPNEVRSWDITKLKGPARGMWYLLYVILGIYSRKAIHWEIWPAEAGTLAKEFIEHAIAAIGPRRHLGPRPGPPRRHPPGRLPGAPRAVPRPLPAAEGPARQGVDQRATRDHRDQPTTTNRTSSLMSH
jgi:putative transposase